MAFGKAWYSFRPTRHLASSEVASDDVSCFYHVNISALILSELRKSYIARPVKYFQFIAKYYAVHHPTSFGDRAHDGVGFQWEVTRKRLEVVAERFRVGGAASH